MLLRLRFCPRPHKGSSQRCPDLLGKLGGHFMVERGEKDKKRERRGGKGRLQKGKRGD